MEIRLKEINYSAASYISKWKSDSFLSKKLMKKKEKINLKEAEKWIDINSSDKNQILRGIFLIKENKKILIGLARLMFIDYKSKVAELGIYIGEKKYIGLGLGTKAIKLLIIKAFLKLKLRKIFLRVNKKNRPAIKLYEKMNFKIEGIMFQNYYNREKNFFEDVIYMSLFNEKLFK